MTTSNSPVPISTTGPLRVLLAKPRRHRRLDGGWWPRSRDLAVELADLVAGLPADSGRVVRAVYSPPDWDNPPRRVPLASGYLKVGCFPRDDSHLLDLRMLDGTILRLLVVPPGAGRSRARTALETAAETEETGTVASILAGMADDGGDGGDGEQVPADPQEHWTDDGGAWWDPHPVSPSYRPEE